MTRRYYSVRTGKNQGKISLSLSDLQKLFVATFRSLDQEGYFQESMGYYCVDSGRNEGSMGAEPDLYSYMKTRKSGLLPIESDKQYSDEDIFDLIEFLYDHVSAPIEGRYHDYANCGWHYYKFDQASGQDRFRNLVNEFLMDYQEGWELSSAGEVLRLGDSGTTSLLVAELPNADPKNVNSKLDIAIQKFRRHKSSLEDRKDAVRDLVDILEFLRPQIKTVLLSRDEADLFNLANNFSIRHHNQLQKTDYDQSIWLSWMFYVFLSTIHAAVRLIEKQSPHQD